MRLWRNCVATTSTMDSLCMGMWLRTEKSENSPENIRLDSIIHNNHHHHPCNLHTFELLWNVMEKMIRTSGWLHLYSNMMKKFGINFYSLLHQRKKRECWRHLYHQKPIISQSQKILPETLHWRHSRWKTN